MLEYRTKLQELLNSLNSQVQLLNKNSANFATLIEEASYLFTAIGMTDSSLNAYEHNKHNFEGDVVSSFTEFDGYFSELSELCEQFIERCKTLR